MGRAVHRAGGYWPHYDYRTGESSWPFLRGLTLSELALYAKSNAVTHEMSEWGDIFLQYSTRARDFIHVGIVLSATAPGRYSHLRSYVDIYSIKGNTDASAGRRGGRALRVRRRLLPSHGDCFVRWTALPTRASSPGMAYLASVLDARKVS